MTPTPSSIGHPSGATFVFKHAGFAQETSHLTAQHSFSNTFPSRYAQETSHLTAQHSFSNTFPSRARKQAVTNAWYAQETSHLSAQHSFSNTFPSRYAQETSHLSAQHSFSNTFPSRARKQAVTNAWFSTTLLLLLLSGCSKPAAKEAADAVAPVSVAPAAKEPIQRIVTASAVLFPKDQSAVTPKISAPVRKFLVNRGDRVAAGQLLAELENRDLQAAVSESKSLADQAESAYRGMSKGSLPQELAKAKSDLQAAREALDAARKLSESRTELFKQGALARRQVDEANVAFALAKSQFEIAQKQLDTLQSVGQQEQMQGAKDQLEAARARSQASQAQLSYSEIRSPIAGVVTDRPVFAGEMAAAGTPLLTVMDISRVIAKANLPQADAARLKVGYAATIVAPEGEAKGKVTVISPAINANSTTVEVWVEAANPQALLKPGGTVRVEIEAETVPDAVVVPLSALINTKEGELVVLVAGDDSAAHEHKVETGIRTEDKVQIVKGLKAGEKVIVTGGVGLEDGAKIKDGDKK
jgi:multidrug efflux pump subunit AcrA (membrane-fusion protein)